MKVLFFYNGIRSQTMKDFQEGKGHGDHMDGMPQLRKLGIDSDFQELEKVYPEWICKIIRKYVPIYFVQVPIFWKIFGYNIIVSSSAFGIQTLYSIFKLFGLRRPKWVMLDWSLTGLLNKGGLSSRILKWTTNHAGGIVTIGKKEEDILKKLFPGKPIKFIPLGTNTNFSKPQNVSEENQIITVGKDPARDYATLFAACDGLGVKLIATSSRKLSMMSKVPDFVSSKYYTDSELLTEYSKSKIVVLPLDIKDGLNETAGISTLVQAMAMGKAIIITRTDTTESYITHGENGFLVKTGDVEEMRFLIVRLLKNDKERIEIGRKARGFILKECTSEIFVERLAKFFTKVNKS